ncbi:hypothetical protein OESDEN_02995 [Oesophagostomum dentatum]|uniref:Uncharacterized protein n=1 Tax=Oesophagostomum dentatum TaxID=61180 RepID=A0A0B1TIE9_OESDE|nr:hypothetical protein OESDEN_02995 [Oesophagostomum dentatum]
MEDRKGTLESKERIQKGLSPPKNDEERENNCADKEIRTCPTFNSMKEMSSKTGLFDKTQWERTRFAKEAAGIARSTDLRPKKQEESRESQMLAESKQSLAVRGEYLNELPKPTLILLVVEVVSTAHFN